MVLISSSSHSFAPVYKFDHQFSSVGNDAPLVILYGELGTPEFSSFHSALLEMTTENQVQYVFRHYYKVEIVDNKLCNGYYCECSLNVPAYF